jgi:hypothetical protein
MNSIRINISILITIGHHLKNHNNLYFYEIIVDCLCGLVVRVHGYRSGGPGSIPGTTRRKK